MGEVKRLLIIGQGGFIGGHLARAAQGWLLCDSTGIDIRQPVSVHQIFERERPEAVVLLAAISDIDRCQREPDLARSVNIDGARHVAEECARRNIRLVFTSTGAVFDGTRERYSEDDTPTPMSVYGETKTEAELILRKIVPDCAIVRIGLVLGHGHRKGTNSLVDRLENDLSQGHEVAVPTEEIRNPIDVATLCQYLLALADKPSWHGTFHTGSTDCRSRYEIARMIAAHLGAPEKLIQPSTGSTPDRAPRGRIHYLIPDKLAALTGIPAQTCDQVVERCLFVSA